MTQVPVLSPSNNMATGSSRHAAADHGRGEPDPRALAVAAELQRHLPDARVLLFGSRAVGTWQPGSDIDLAVIGEEDHTRVLVELEKLAEPHRRAVYGDDAPYVQIFAIPSARFLNLRTSLPHIAGQVQRHGLTPAGEHLPLMDPSNPWPKVQELLVACRLNLSVAFKTLADQIPHTVLFNAQGALECAVKAVLEATETKFERNHKLVDLVESLPRDQHWLKDKFPPDRLRTLTLVRERAMYMGVAPPAWQSLAPQVDDVVVDVQAACRRLAGQALRLMDNTPRDIGYAAADWITDGPLAGWGSLPLNHIRQVNRFRLLCADVLPPEVLQRIESNWLQHGPPADAPARIAALFTDPENPDVWPRLLVAAGNREPDADRVRPPRDASASDDRPVPKGW